MTTDITEKKDKKNIFWIIIALLIAIAAFQTFTFIKLAIIPSIDSTSLDSINLPPGFNIDIFADELGGSLVSYPGPNAAPRMMMLKYDILFVPLARQGKVVALPDNNADNKADETITFIDNLNKPHGLDFYDGWFYIAEENRLIRVKDTDNNQIADTETLPILIDDLPTGSHFTRTTKIHNDSLYLSTGSSCNVCYEKDAIMRTFSNTVSATPIAYTYLMGALDFAVGPASEMVIMGDLQGDDTQAMLKALRGEFIPNKVVVFRPAGVELSEIADIVDVVGYISDMPG